MKILAVRQMNEKSYLYKMNTKIKKGVEKV